MKNILQLAGGALLALSIVVITLQRGAIRKVQVELLNTEARADTTRVRYADSLRIAERLAEHVQIELSNALQQGQARGATLVRLRAERDSLRQVTQGTGEVHDTASQTLVATGELDADSLGVTVRTIVSTSGVLAVREPQSIWTWDVVRHPIALEVALVCLPDHRAEARITGPPHLPLTITGAASRPDVCFPKPSWSPFSFKPPSLLWLGVAFGAGIIVAK